MGVAFSPVSPPCVVLASTDSPPGGVEGITDGVPGDCGGSVEGLGAASDEAYMCHVGD